MLGRVLSALDGLLGRVAARAGYHLALPRGPFQRAVYNLVMLVPYESRGLAGGTGGNHPRDPLLRLEL